jgi:hypothetical protein
MKLKVLDVSFNGGDNINERMGSLGVKALIKL